MAALEQASGPEFDRTWLKMMIEHHRGAVDMAQNEVEDGSDPYDIKLASTITDTQQAEITEMEQLLTQL